MSDASKLALHALEMIRDANRDEPHIPATALATVEQAIAALNSEQLCLDCPPVGYDTDRTRCFPCPRRDDALDRAPPP